MCGDLVMANVDHAGHSVHQYTKFEVYRPFHSDAKCAISSKLEIWHILHLSISQPRDLDI